MKQCNTALASAPAIPPPDGRLSHEDTNLAVVGRDTVTGLDEGCLCDKKIGSGGNNIVERRGADDGGDSAGEKNAKLGSNAAFLPETIPKAASLKAEGNETLRRGELERVLLDYSNALGLLNAAVFCAPSMPLPKKTPWGLDKVPKKTSTLRAVLHRNRAAVLLRSGC